MSKVKEVKIVTENEVCSTRDICGWVKDLIDPSNSDVQNVNVALIVVEPEKESMSHFHRQTEEIYYIIDGTGEITLDSKKFVVAMGSTIFIPICVRHTIKNTGQSDLRFLSIDAPPYDPNDVYH